MKEELLRKDEIDRRRYIRTKFPFTIHIITGEGCKFSVYTENVSQGGLMVTLMHELELASPADLEIFTRERTIVCSGKISWIKKRESKYLEGRDFFDTGIEFNSIKPEDKDLIQNQMAGNSA